MVTTEEIESLGWVCYTTDRNGGSKKFTKRQSGFRSMSGTFSIFSHADNPTISSESKEDMTISKYKIDMSLVVLFTGKVRTLDELKEALIKLGADRELIRDHKIDQIVD